MRFKYFLSILNCVFVILGLSSCGKKNINLPDKNINIIFTGGVHSFISKPLGYQHVSALKKDLSKSSHTVLVDLGDAISGTITGTVSKGMYIVQLMNESEYDYAIIGNHEFDFGMRNFSNCLKESKTVYLNTNIRYTGMNEDYLEETFPYHIKDFSGTKIAFLGVTTPTSMITANPENFMEEGKSVYDFAESKDGGNFFRRVQKYIDIVKKQGADFVILLSHLDNFSMTGKHSVFSPFTLVNHTSGIDCVLAATSIDSKDIQYARNISGKEIPIAFSGENFSQIGIATISTEGNFSFSAVTSYENKDSAVTESLIEIAKKVDKEINEQVSFSDIQLSIFNEDGIRIVRSRETAIGNLCADAYRLICQADIGFANGGAIRASLPQGKITMADIIKINPFDNKICCRKVTGQQILDALEFGAQNTLAQVESEGKPAGEFGGFLQVSGMRYTIDTSIPSPIVVSEKGKMTDIHGYRRIKNAEILRNGKYIPIAPRNSYTVASQDFLIKCDGDGNTALKEGELLMDDLIVDNQALIFYLTDFLNYDVSSKYNKTEGRITVE